MIVDFEGNLWVTDFGLAHIEGDPAMTMTGDLIGTLRYMSPEQVLAKRVVVDHRTDIYSLGATLYELLTLRPMHDADNRPELIRQIAFEEPKPPRKINHRIPRDLSTVVLKATSKRAEERYATADELADDLKRFLADEPIRAQPPTLVDRATKWARRHRLVIVGATSSLVMLMTVAGGFLLANNLQMQEERKRTEAEKQRAEVNFQKAREAVDRMFTRAAKDLADQPHMEKIRQALTRLNKTTSDTLHK